LSFAVKIRRRGRSDNSGDAETGAATERVNDFDTAGFDI
jgi:hypothetical protein